MLTLRSPTDPRPGRFARNAKAKQYAVQLRVFGKASMHRGSRRAERRPFFRNEKNKEKEREMSPCFPEKGCVFILREGGNCNGKLTERVLPESSKDLVSIAMAFESTCRTPPDACYA